ncbi:MAG: hypothetical protein PWP14_1821 [Methanolobus sp.]|nr:hypothetical protein [Methanolobus sp.]MDN5310427.1 hypothetical protein [Methanolobus sp.]
MPPHCDTRDGPVAKAVERSLESENVNPILIWLPDDSEAEMKMVFDKAIKARKLGKEAKEVADEWVLETAVRLHRKGEGAVYSGIKPAGLDEGPVVPRAERAIDTENLEGMMDFMTDTLENELQKRFREVVARKNYDVNDVAAGREYVHAFMNFVVYSHHLYLNIIEKHSH